MTPVSLIAIDLAKNVFQLHGVDIAGAVLFRKRLRREALRDFLRNMTPVTIAMEACATAHYWAREFSNLGHSVDERPLIRCITFDRVICGGTDRNIWT